MATVSRRKEEFMQKIDLCKKHVNEDGKLVLSRGNPVTRGLANWLNRQFKRDNVPEDEKALLDLLRQHRDTRRRPDKQDESWKDCYEQLIAYKEEYHTLVISKKDKDHKRLYNWTFRQRRLEKEDHLLPDRTEALVNIGFSFGKPKRSLEGAKRFTKEQREKWDNMYQELVDFKNEFGHCRVKIDDEEHLELAKWVHQQRITFQKGQMDQRRETRLNDIGFIWKVR
jgi:hypothetical protein